MCELGALRDSDFDTLVNLTADGEEFVKDGGVVGDYDASAQGTFFVEGNCCARWEWTQPASLDYARSVRVVVESDDEAYRFGFEFKIRFGILHCQKPTGTGRGTGSEATPLAYDDDTEFAIGYEAGEITLYIAGFDAYPHMTVPTDRTYHLVVEAASDAGGTARIAEIQEQDGCDAQGTLPLLEVSMTMTVAAPPLPVGMLPLLEVSMTMDVSPAAEDLCGDEMTLTEDDCTDEMTLTEGEVSPT